MNKAKVNAEGSKDKSLYRNLKQAFTDNFWLRAAFVKLALVLAFAILLLFYSAVNMLGFLFSLLTALLTP